MLEAFALQCFKKIYLKDFSKVCNYQNQFAHLKKKKFDFELFYFHTKRLSVVKVFLISTVVLHIDDKL